MSDLLDEMLAAHGGEKRWNEITNINIQLAATGAVWTLKGQPTLFAKVSVDVDPHSQRVSATPFVHHGWRGIFEPGRVRIENESGVVEEDRTDPRSSFDGHVLQTPWDHLHAIYFGGYALWTYVTLPFLLTEPGVSTIEIEPWTENSETWRRLRVTFPDNIATHSTEQVFYVDHSGLIRRHDYTAGITGGGPAAHYLHGHQKFDGIVFPKVRKVFLRQSDNTYAQEPVLIDMAFERYTLT